MKSYIHFTLEERECLQVLREKGKSIREIARFLDRSPSSVSRELKRNWSKKANHYHPWHAHTNYLHNRKRCHRKNNLLLNEEMYRFALQGLSKYWSPEIIAGAWNKDHEEKFSFSSVYRAVRSGLFPGIKPWIHFRRKGKPYAIERKRYTHHKENSIHDRPKEVDERTRFGDFEGDTIYGSVGKGYLVTCVDRCSRLLLAAKCSDKRAETINNAIAEALSRVPAMVTPKTLTLDNGTEFAEYEKIEKRLGLNIYFADLHAPWQRGSNENVNGLLRFFFPRGTNFNEMPRSRIDEVVDLINSRPRKCLGFLSPLEFIHKSVALGLTI